MYFSSEVFVLKSQFGQWTSTHFWSELLLSTSKDGIYLTVYFPDAFAYSKTESR